MWCVTEHEFSVRPGVDFWDSLKELATHIRATHPELRLKLLSSNSLGTGKAWAVAEVGSLAEWEQFLKEFWADKWVTDFSKRNAEKAKGSDGLTSWNWRYIYFDEVSVT